MSLPPVVLVRSHGVGRHVNRACTALGPVLPFFGGFQLECACMQQRLLERQELHVLGGNGAGTEPVSTPASLSRLSA